MDAINLGGDEPLSPASKAAVIDAVPRVPRKDAFIRALSDLVGSADVPSLSLRAKRSNLPAHGDCFASLAMTGGRVRAGST
jgi:hypothetical protein